MKKIGEWDEVKRSYLNRDLYYKYVNERQIERGGLVCDVLPSLNQIEQGTT